MNGQLLIKDVARFFSKALHHLPMNPNRLEYFVHRVTFEFQLSKFGALCLIYFLFLPDCIYTILHKEDRANRANCHK